MDRKSISYLVSEPREKLLCNVVPKTNRIAKVRLFKRLSSQVQKEMVNPKRHLGGILGLRDDRYVWPRPLNPES